MRHISRLASDGSDLGAHEQAVYDPKDYKHTCRELGQYQAAAVKAISGSQFLSMSGADATKVGTDFPLQMAAVMNSETGVTAWTAPQVT